MEKIRILITIVLIASPTIFGIYNLNRYNDLKYFMESSSESELIEKFRLIEESLIIAEEKLVSAEDTIDKLNINMKETEEGHLRIKEILRSSTVSLESAKDGIEISRISLLLIYNLAIEMDKLEELRRYEE